MSVALLMFLDSSCVLILMKKEHWKNFKRYKVISHGLSISDSIVQRKIDERIFQRLVLTVKKYAKNVLKNESRFEITRVHGFNIYHMLYTRPK